MNINTLQKAGCRWARWGQRHTLSFLKFSAFSEPKGRVIPLVCQETKFLQVKKLEGKFVSLQKSPFLKSSSYTLSQTFFKFFLQPKESTPESPLPWLCLKEHLSPSVKSNYFRIFLRLLLSSGLGTPLLSNGVARTQAWVSLGAEHYATTCRNNQVAWSAGPCLHRLARNSHK